jgi:hypothetical protein
MEQANISIYGNNAKELETRINFVYGFISQNQNYFLTKQKSYGLKGYEDSNVTKYQYQKRLYNIIYRPITENTDMRIYLETLKFSSNHEAIKMANNYKRIIGDLKKQYWGYWDFDNLKYIDGYFQYHINPNFRVDPYVQ